MIETGQKHFVLHKYEDFVPIVEWVASCDCIVEKIGLRGWEKCYGKNKPVSSILHKDLFLFGPFGSFEETAKINPPWYVMDIFSQCIECCLQQSHPHVSELFTSVFWGFMTLAAKGVGCCGVSVGGDGTLVFELFSCRGWRGRSLGGVGLLPLFFVTLHL